jgi:carbamate kinase
MFDENGDLHGVEAVVDKDATSAMLAEQLEADLLVIATDVDAVYLDWGTARARRLDRATPDQLDGLGLAEGSMGPKVEAAARFVRATGKRAVIGSLDDLADLVAGTAGTVIESGG